MLSSGLRGQFQAMEDRSPLGTIQQNGSTVQTNSAFPFKVNYESVGLQSRYRDLVAKGKSAAAEGKLEDSLNAFKEAFKITPTDKIEQRIKKIEAVLEEVGENEENDDFVQLDNGMIIYRQLVERLYPHQIEGVKWMYGLQNKRKKGGILADDMGLGKTIQVISVLSAMFDMELIQHVLLVLPLSLIPNWQREFEKWAPGIKLKAFYGSPRERTKALEYSQRRPAVCLTTYGLVQTKWEQLGQTSLRQEFVWDYIILDEGHKIKNPSKTTKGLHAIPSKNRLILTGTPIQNNLRELWALFDWVMQGTLLGTQKTFKMEYETPITRARQRGASSAEIHLGNYMAESLRKIVDPYILRRTKGSVSAMKPGDIKPDENMNTNDKRPSFPKLKKKNDFVIWTYLSSVQEEIYRDFLGQDSIKELLASKRSPLVYLTILKKICDHPRLLPRSACHQLGMEGNDSLHEDDFHTEKGKECAANRIDNISDETLIQESGKLQFLFGLLKKLREEGHRTLIFSLSRKILNIIHRILLNNKFKVMRLDGTISKLEERELRVKKFQQDSSYDVFLLTTQVGGVGLTLTAADRVVIFDPSWNPATDAQAVDRIYRIGQEKNVVVYRLITCGTVEEKIYRRQIFKDSIIKQNTGDNKDPYRYFTNHELKELFQLESTKESMTQKQLQELHGDQRCLEPKLNEHIEYLHSLPMFGVSDHDLMFSQDPDDVEDDVMEEHKDVIHNKVAEARNRVELEARQFTGGEVAEERWGDFNIETKPYEPRVKEDEPKYEIEGLYDKMDSLKVDDDVIENIFNQSRISIISDSDDNQPSSSNTANNAICIVDSDEDIENLGAAAINQNEFTEEKRKSQQLEVLDEPILAADTPVRNNKSEIEEMGALEIGDSFMSDFEIAESKNNSIVETPEVSTVRESDVGLLNADISNIHDGRISRESDMKSSDLEALDNVNIEQKIDVPTENQVDNEENEDEYIFDDPSLGDLYLPGSSGSSRAVTPALVDAELDDRADSNYPEDKTAEDGVSDGDVLRDDQNCDADSGTKVDATSKVEESCMEENELDEDCNKEDESLHDHSYASQGIGQNHTDGPKDLENDGEISRESHMDEDFIESDDSLHDHSYALQLDETDGSNVEEDVADSFIDDNEDSHSRLLDETYNSNIIEDVTDESSSSIDKEDLSQEDEVEMSKTDALLEENGISSEDDILQKGHRDSKLQGFYPLNNDDSDVDSPIIKSKKSKHRYLEEEEEDDDEFKLNLSESDEDSMLG